MDVFFGFMANALLHADRVLSSPPAPAPAPTGGAPAVDWAALDVQELLKHLQDSRYYSKSRLDLQHRLLWVVYYLWTDHRKVPFEQFKGHVEGPLRSAYAHIFRTAPTVPNADVKYINFKERPIPKFTIKFSDEETRAIFELRTQSPVSDWGAVAVALNKHFPNRETPFTARLLQTWFRLQPPSVHKKDAEMRLTGGAGLKRPLSSSIEDVLEEPEPEPEGGEEETADYEPLKKRPRLD